MASNTHTTINGSPHRVYVVNALHWEWTDEWYAIQNDSPVRAFASREEAERYRERLENEKARDLGITPGSSAVYGRDEWYTPYTESHVPEPFYEVVEVEYLP